VASENVVGLLPGSDPTLKNEPVIFAAHYDHKGIGHAVNGDSIYNGAEDNASGVAAILAAAEALSRSGQRTRRPILFIATTAEESGLLGSEAYAARPLYPLARTAAVINIDVTNTRGPTRDISALGVDRSTLGPLFDAAARGENLKATSEPDTRGSFFRSDHFPFVRAGVPALSLKPGLDFVGRPAGWGKEQEDLYNEKRYHQPGDEYSTSFNYDGMVQQIRVALRVALAVGNAPTLPDWLPTAEFRRPR
jgi:Zn-dependent M28 family amino/carboxypeptidase